MVRCHAPLATQELLCLLILFPIAACGPNKGVNEPPPNLGGTTTDTFNITVLRDEAPFPNPLPLRDATVLVRFVDTDNIDPATGQYTVRRERHDLTDGNGFWTVRVTYDGAGEYAADKVRYLVTHPSYLNHPWSDKPIRNNVVTTQVILIPDMPSP